MPSRGTKHVVFKLPLCFAPFYGNLTPTYFAHVGGVRFKLARRSTPQRYEQ